MNDLRLEIPSHVPPELVLPYDSALGEKIISNPPAALDDIVQNAPFFLAPSMEGFGFLLGTMISDRHFNHMNCLSKTAVFPKSHIP